jgi:hypothetical protein
MRSSSGVRLRRMLTLAASAVLTVSVGACLQIDTQIEVQPDGGALVTERLQLSQELLDQGSKENIAKFLGREAALARMKQMGQDLTLVSHETRDAPGGARESVAVYRVPDIRGFTYVSPYLAVANYPKHHAIKTNLFPVYESTWWGRRAGMMGASFTSVSEEPQRGAPPAPPPPPSPAELQALRDVQPVFRDLLKGFHLKFTFKSYAPLRFRQYYRYRGMREMTQTYDLIDFSDQNLDNYGAAFIGNEEIMLELLRMQVSGFNITEHVKTHADNPTLPVFHFRNTPEIYFAPSRPMFDQYFAGKDLTFSHEEGGPRPAKFEEIGFKGGAITQPAKP